MATLPRSSIKYPPGPPRPVSEFDSGINTSTAWTEHLEGGHTSSSTRKYLSESNLPTTISDEEDMEEITYPARTLYKFEGKSEFRELSVEAGDEVEVLKEDVGEGWSLVRDSLGKVGLLPQSYYALTSELAEDGSVTPRRSSSPSKLIIQNTGEWRGPFQSLLGGKSINRFSSFVTSGAEAFILSGSPALESKGNGHSKEDTSVSMLEANEEEHLRLTRLGLGEADCHFIDVGPSWRTKTPPFSVLVHSPSKRSSVLSGTYTMYNVTSIFPTASPATDWVEVPDPEDRHPPSPTSPSSPATKRISVLRRFSHFVMLHTALSRRLPGIALPPLPEKQYAGRFSDDFVEARRGDLERYLNKIVRHPVVRYAEIVVLFLGCENDNEWARLLPKHLSMPAAGPAFYARVYHPAFNLDLEDAKDTLRCFQNHTKAVGKGIQGLRTVFGRVRESRIEMSKAERLLSYSLLSLITSKPLESTSCEEDDHPSNNHNDNAKGLVNSYGAWCWQEGCVECLKLTKSLQKTADTLQTVANLYEGHARRTQLATHESLKLLAHPATVYEGVIRTHRSTLTRYREAIGTGPGVSYADEHTASRCETVLNTTMAEMDVYHEQKIEDMKTVVGDHLDGEIILYEQILTRLKSARNHLSSSSTSSSSVTPIRPSIHEKDLESLNLISNLNLNYKPLTQPCPHVFDSTPMRPASVALALQEGVGLFLGGGGGGETGVKERGGEGVFGKFW